MGRFLARFCAFRRQMQQEFLEHVRPLLSNSMVRRLDLQSQHYKYTRLRHSVDVAYRCYFLSRLFGWQYSASLAKAALLHDFFFLEEGMNSLTLFRSHPQIAVENAAAITTLSPMEQDIIEKHMFFANFTLPRYKESVLLIVVDNLSFVAEMAISLFTRRSVVAALPETCAGHGLLALARMPELSQ